jgi:hypothetical protein
MIYLQYTIAKRFSADLCNIVEVKVQTQLVEMFLSEDRFSNNRSTRRSQFVGVEIKIQTFQISP